MRLFLYIPLTVSFLFLFVTSSFSQGKKSYKEEVKAEQSGYKITKVSDKLMASNERGEFHFVFSNVNNIAYYHNADLIAKIKQYKKEQNQVDLVNAIEKYVSHFGIENFDKDINLLWQLAQLYESLGELEKAKTAYRLVLRHHKTNLFSEVKQYFKILDQYDTLMVNQTDYYVPLDYYYELVEYRKNIDTLTPPKSILTNMGDLVNKKGTPDYGPSISKGDNLMIFTRKEHDDYILSQSNHFNEDLYFSQGYEDDFWDEAVKFEEPINSRCNEGSACLSKDGNTLYFSRCLVQEHALDCSDCMGKCDIYVSYKGKDGKWSKPENLGANVNSRAWDSHPSLSASEDTLFFASDRPGGFGLSDIYFTYKKRGKWVTAENLGPTVNTRNNEYSPFVNWVHNVFYFSSNGQLYNFNDVGQRKKNRTLDIYKTKLYKDYAEEPKNIGPLVNGQGNEFYFTIDSKSENLYYAKTEENVDDPLITDLYSFPVPMEAQPNATSRLSGTLTDKETGDPYKGIVSVIDIENGIEVAPKNVRPDGSYDFDLINHKNYLLIIQGDEFFRIEELFKMTGDTTINSKATSIANRKLQFSSLEFERGKAEILPEMEKDLWDVINFLVDNPMFNLEIGGHTDTHGDADANKLLSQRRADAIKQFIEEQGHIDSERVTGIGYGSSKPLRSPEITDEDKKINRRVEFEILFNGKKEETFSDEDFEDSNEDESNDEGW